MKISVILTLAFLAGIDESAVAAKPLTTSASGKIESLTASGNGSYRVTLRGFARVLRVEPEESVIACLRKGSEKGEALELTIDLNGNILGCKASGQMPMKSEITSSLISIMAWQSSLRLTTGARPRIL